MASKALRKSYHKGLRLLEIAYMFSTEDKIQGMA